MKIRLGQIELARGLAQRETPTRFSLATTRDTQVAKAVRASVAEIFDRGNTRTLAAFTVARKHASVERALRFAAEHPLSLAGATGGLTFVSEDGASEAEMYLPDAAVRAVHCQPDGLLTHTDYEFIGSALTCRPASA